MDEILPRFGLAIAISQITAARDHGTRQRRARAVRRAQRQHQTQNGEKYAATGRMRRIGSIDCE